jgi:hypothetical protein
VSDATDDVNDTEDNVSETETPPEPTPEPEVKRFRLVRKQIPVELEDAGGKVLRCVMRELDGQERDKFLNIMSTRMKTDAKGKPSGVKDFTNLQASLLVASLFKPDGKPFTSAELQKFPSSTQTELFKMAQKLSGLDEKAETTSTEFVDWMVHLRDEPNRFRPEHYYLAQIAFLIGNLFAEKDKIVPLEKFLLKFDTVKEKVVEDEETQQEKEEAQEAYRAAMSQMRWMTLLGSAKKKKEARDAAAGARKPPGTPHGERRPV